MQIIASDLLTDLSVLSLGLILLLVPVGFALWLLGWWSHRFWIVLATTVLAGIVGLNEATTWQTQPIVVALLLAIAAGVLALALVRVIAFVAGGALGLTLVQLTLPTLHQPIITFLVCGLLSLLLFRWCFMALTSLLGSVLLIYAALALLQYYQVFDAVKWNDANRIVVNTIGGVLAFLGFAFQVFLNRWQIRRQRQDDDDEEEENEGGAVANILSLVIGKKRHAA